MKAIPFHGIDSILEVHCSGTEIDADAKLVSLMLYQKADTSGDKVLASVSLLDDVCSTSASFSSCTVNRRDTRLTSVKTLVFDMSDMQERHYGCDVTSLKPSNRPQVESWSLVVKGISKCLNIDFNLANL